MKKLFSRKLYNQKKQAKKSILTIMNHNKNLKNKAIKMLRLNKKRSWKEINLMYDRVSTNQDLRIVLKIKLI